MCGDSPGHRANAGLSMHSSPILPASPPGAHHGQRKSAGAAAESEAPPSNDGAQAGTGKAPLVGERC